jgi:ribulose-phosphate 3-epimerase
MTIPSIKIAPSLLSADFSRLAEEMASLEVAGADWLHVDVMDGHFVPNITIGPPVVESIRKATSLPLDLHLMIEKPENYLSDFAKAGGDIITVQVEACVHLHRIIQFIKDMGIKAGVALNPTTPLSSLEYILDDVDLVLIMTVNPGFGGQQFIESMFEKIVAARKMLDTRGLPVELEVDGGINLENVSEVAKAGPTVIVSGSGILGTVDYSATISKMRQEIERALGEGGPHEG